MDADQCKSSFFMQKCPKSCKLCQIDQRQLRSGNEGDNFPECKPIPDPTDTTTEEEKLEMTLVNLVEAFDDCKGILDDRETELQESRSFLG